MTHPLISRKKENVNLNLLTLYISMHILHTVLCTFTKLLSRRICLQSRASLAGDLFLYSYDINV